ncbi:MAG: DUF721 domain-containing protein [Leptolyngbyaceae cyanobacterium RU_5_1]|nr:DUF721 domain-containing protein [Leptolyngbyaceae cyanobacterium RU_5_1]
MSLQSLNQVLGNLKHQYRNREQQTLQQVVSCWSEVVGSIVAAQTQPLSIQRKILRVATSSSAWAQNLVFERQRIMDKLNRSLSVPIVDIRFSTAQWHQTERDPSFAGAEQQAELWRAHPSRLSGQPASPPNSPSKPEQEPKPIDPVSAFQYWAKQMRSRSHHFPLCPQCQCPTPPGEIDRWQVCALCAAKRW